MKNPFDFFDKIYCINLNERTDRWQSCLKKFEKYDIQNVERVEAIKPNIYEDKKTNARLGCTSSWEKVLKKILNENVNHILVLEDDFEFRFEKDELFNKLNNSISELPSDWDIFYLGGLLTDHEINPPIENYSKHLYKLLSCYSTHSISFSKKCINEILNFYENDWSDIIVKNFDCVDVFFARKILYAYNSFISDDLLCFQEKGESDIENCYMDIQNYLIDSFNLQKEKLK